MAARAIASGTISFGLVSIPVKVYAASRSQSVHFNMLHAKDSSRVKQQLVCGTCGEVVPRDETVRGYEYARGQYVVFTDDELKGLQKKSDQSIEIVEFIPMAEVDPIFFERSSLLGPDKGGAKAYRLLRQAMERTARVAVGRYSTRGKQQLVLIRPVADGLVLHGLHYADEVRSFDDVDLGDEIEFKKGELDLAEQLIDQLSGERFQPEKYEDEYRRDVLAAAERKAAGEEVVVGAEAEPREQIIDLVAALKQSIGEKRAAPPKRVRKGARAKGKPAARRKSASS
jgi:DNA end-binding protein Ku